MLSFVAEKIPSSGALGLSLMGGLGMFSVSIVLWAMGLVMDMDATGSDTLYIMALLPFLTHYLRNDNSNGEELPRKCNFYVPLFDDHLHS